MKNLLTITLLFSFFLANAQVQESDSLESKPAIPIDKSLYKKNKFKFSWGVRGGLSKTRVNTTSGDVIQITQSGTPLISNGSVVRDELVSNSAFGNGYQGAIFGRFISGSFYLQPEVIYGSKGGKFDFLDKNGNLLNRVDAKFTAIDVPVLLGIRFRDARIFAGPVVSYALNKNSAFETSLAPYTNENLSKDFLEKPIINGIVGLGFEFKYFFFDFRYEAGIQNYAQTTLGPSNNPKIFNFTTDQFILSIGLIK
ncbi:porin family protein [Arcticibacterium luteifluviistationis]|uniref:Outer membrane protein beta-barrel domain-containing protein n=1 Tax=Arcticibacterium luteifluviistationis TaxID=1784714 RepID=A0A2Z4GD77_9BACT|nr:porin family protein [Arcticibacterium luteifluviistationis]AWV98975.1 hypothetical protein DJ013_12680 [Arcticibacterium luteifluviistationis]